jgi:hypothetical protein
LILATAFIGAQQAIRAIGMQAGGYPNEFDLANKIRSGETLVIGWTFYLYLFFIFVLTGLGIFVQLQVLKNWHQAAMANSLKKGLLDVGIELNESK